MKVNEYMSQPEIKSVKAIEPEFPDYAIHIDDRNFTWGVQTMDLDEMYEKMAKEMRWDFSLGRKERKKSKEEIEAKERREKEKAQ